MATEKTKNEKLPEDGIKCRLGDIIGAVLRNLSWAQHLANEFSSGLSSHYKKDELLRHFQVPNAELKKIGLNIKFAVKDISKEIKPLEDIVITPGEAFVKGAELMTQHIVLQTGHFLNKIRHPDIKPDQRELLAKNIQSSRFREFLKERILNTMLQNVKYIVDDQNRLDQQEILKLVMNVTKKNVLEHRDLSEVFKEKKAKDEIIKKIQPELQAICKQIQSILHRIKLKTALELDVIADAGHLSEIPDHAVFNAGLEIELQNYNWVISEKKDITDDNYRDTEEQADAVKDYLIRG